jgi:hypothetical protein
MTDEMGGEGFIRDMNWSRGRKRRRGGGKKHGVRFASHFIGLNEPDGCNVLCRNNFSGAHMLGGGGGGEDGGGRGGGSPLILPSHTCASHI